MTHNCLLGKLSEICNLSRNLEYSPAVRSWSKPWTPSTLIRPSACAYAGGWCNLGWPAPSARAESACARSGNYTWIKHWVKNMVRHKACLSKMSPMGSAVTIVVPPLNLQKLEQSWYTAPKMSIHIRDWTNLSLKALSPRQRQNSRDSFPQPKCTALRA